MSTVLLLAPDAVFAAVLEDHLRVAGHQIVLAQDAAAVVEHAAGGTVDLAVLDGERQATREALRALRASPPCQALPVLILSLDDDRESRLESLRAGADDHLGRPLDLEELMLRIARLLGRRPQAPQLAGALTGHPLPDLLQYVQQAAKSGRLVVTGERERGEATFRRGQLIAAQWGSLRSSEAALALLGLERGSFRFESHPESEPDEVGAVTLPLQKLVLHAVWLTDELAARRQFLPATGAALRIKTSRQPEAGRDFEVVPVRRVFERIRAGQGIRLFDLIADQAEAPIATRLATAWLIEQGAVEAFNRQRTVLPTTTEISSSMLFDLNLTAFLSTAQKAGLRADPLPLLIVASVACRARIVQLLQGVHGYQQKAALRLLAERLETASGASAVFPCQQGKLSLHVQLLEDEGRSPLDSVVPVCGGVLVWLSGKQVPAAVARIVKRLEASRTRARGILVAAGAETWASCRALVEGSGRWRRTEHEPQSLLGILRLLEP